MFSKTKVALSAAIVLNAALPALAATKNHRAASVPPSTYYAAPGDNSGSCSPTPRPGVRLCDNICTGSGPCAPPDRD